MSFRASTKNCRFDMSNHIMKLNPSPFEMIRKGEKTIELRLYDEKRRKILAGDTITFVNSEDENDTLIVKVADLFVFDSFKTLYESLPLLECGYTKADIASASHRDMEAYYSKEEGVTKKYASIKATGKSDIISYANNYQTDLSPLQ